MNKKEIREKPNIPHCDTWNKQRESVSEIKKKPTQTNLITVKQPHKPSPEAIKITFAEKNGKETWKMSHLIKKKRENENKWEKHHARK